MLGTWCVAGDHTRAIQVSTPSSAAGGIMRFAQKKLACLGCKALLATGETTFCKHCKSKVPPTALPSPTQETHSFDIMLNGFVDLMLLL